MGLVDVMRIELNAAVNRAADRGAFLDGVRRGAAILTAALRTRYPGQAEVRVGGDEAARLLGGVIRRLIDLAAARTNRGIEPYRCLWYLRRLDDTLFAGDLESTEPYDRALAEVLAVGRAGWVLPHTPVDKNGLFPIDSAVGRRLAEHCGFTKFVSECQQNFRLIGKGASIVIEQDGQMHAELDDDRRRAVDAYDERMIAGGEILMCGTGSVLALHRESPDARSLTLIGRMARPNVIRVPLGDFDPAEGKVLPSRGRAVTARYTPVFVDASLLYEAMAALDLADPTLWQEELPVLLCFLELLTHLFVRSPDNRVNVIQTGYMLFDPKRFSEVVDNLLPRIQQRFRELRSPIASRVPSTAAELMQQARAIKGSAWPLMRGPIVFPASPMGIGVDFLAVDDRLRKMIGFPRVDGAPANARSRAFEISTQAGIDASDWAPPPELRQLVGRVLRLSGRTIGDIDAIAHKDGRTLLVSCKSYAYSSAYDTGDYREVHSRASKLVADVQKWEELLATLRSNRVGDNYNLGRQNELSGVVTTPHLYYTPPPLCFREAFPGLAWYCSARELQAWLRRG